MVSEMTPDEDDEAVEGQNSSDSAREIVDKKRLNANETVCITDDTHKAKAEREALWFQVSICFAIAAFVSPIMLFSSQSSFANLLWVLLALGSPVGWLITIYECPDELKKDTIIFWISAPIAFFWWIICGLLLLLMGSLPSM